MYILGIDTSTKTGSVALITERSVIAQYSLNIEVTHSERLMATVDRVLNDTGVGMEDIGGFSVAIGPGSFTGLRIGIASVKGLSFATGKPMAAVPTLMAIAANIPFAAHPVCPLLHARKDEVYLSIYRAEGISCVQVIPESAVPISKLGSIIHERTIFTGEGAYHYRDRIESILQDRAVIAPRSSILPSAAVVAEIGLRMILNGCQADPDTITPMYISRPEAEIAWEKKNALP